MEVWFVRHAKSSWGDLNLSDKDRPLNERGHSAAPRMARLLKPMVNYKPLFITSPALRALTTAKYFATEFCGDENQIIIENELYHGHTEELFEILHLVDPVCSGIFLFSHNPDLEQWCSSLKTPFSDAIPTCGVIHCKSTANSWSQIQFSNLHYLKHYFPNSN